MASFSEIEHKAIVEEIGSCSVSLRFIAHSACGACSARGVCSLGESTEKTIRIPLPHYALEKGEEVLVLLTRRLGFAAVIYAYVVPFALVLLTLMILSSVGLNELMSGLLALSALIPYFLLLYLFRKRLEKKYSFSIRKTLKS
jgi:sigma-E factor negative regulatory protein RseC